MTPTRSASPVSTVRRRLDRPPLAARLLGPVVLVGALIVIGCQAERGRSGSSTGHDSASGPLARAANVRRDPCGLVTRQEVEGYLGPLAHDPYRSSTDLKGDPNGSSCVYRTAGGQSIVIAPDWSTGKMTMQINRMGPKMGALILPDESGKADTLGGEWDDIAWIGPGDLFVLKDDVSVDVDVSGSRAGVVGAAKLANDAFPRITKPLVYDGAAPAADAPGPVVAAREPCAVFPRKDVEGVLGPLAGDPVNDPNGGCVFNLAHSLNYLTRVTVEVLWAGGYKKMNRELFAAHQATGGFAAKITPGGTDAIHADTGVQKQIGKLETATGAKVNQDAVFLKTDTSGQPPGPWDEAAVIVGGEFAAVKQDVYMSVDLRLFPIEKARSLVTIGMTHF